jgi:hypothetical protein
VDQGKPARKPVPKSAMVACGAKPMSDTVLFLAEQVAIRGVDTGADQHRLCRLEDLVERADTNGGQILPGVDRPGPGDSLAEDVVGRAEGDGVVEQVTEQFANTTQRAVAGENQAENQLPQPRPGDGQPEEQIPGRLGWVKGQVEPLVSAVELPEDELAADVVVSRDLGDGDAGEGVECQLLAGRPSQGGDAAGEPAWGNELYRELPPGAPRAVALKLIPYYAWGNRGRSEMTVWLPLGR